MTNYYSSMYGAKPPTPASPTPTSATPAVPKAPPPAHQRLSGLKLSNSHMHVLQVGDQQVTLPSAAYIKLLEDQIKEMRQHLRDAHGKIRQISNNQNRLVLELERIRMDMKNKVDLR